MFHVFIDKKKKKKDALCTQFMSAGSMVLIFDGI